MWEGLLGFTFQLAQHNIDFGRPRDWILDGFGLHFGRFFGAKREKVVSLSGFLRKPKKEAKKSHAGNSGKIGPRVVRPQESRIPP